MAVGSQVKLVVYNITGEQVATLVDERQSAGFHEVTFDGSGMASGVYLYRLQAVTPSPGSGQGLVETRKMILMR